MSTRIQNLNEYKFGPNFKIRAKFLNILTKQMPRTSWGVGGVTVPIPGHNWWASFWTHFVLLIPAYWHKLIYPQQLLLTTIVPIPLVSCEWQLEQNTSSGWEFVPSFKASVKITVRFSNCSTSTFFWYVWWVLQFSSGCPLIANQSLGSRPTSTSYWPRQWPQSH